jgi:hypothetical protein
MGSRTMSSFKPDTTAKGERIDYGGNNLNFVGIPKVSLHGSSKNTWGKFLPHFPETDFFNTIFGIL